MRQVHYILFPIKEEIYDNAGEGRLVSIKFTHWDILDFCLTNGEEIKEIEEAVSFAEPCPIASREINSTYAHSAICDDARKKLINKLHIKLISSGVRICWSEWTFTNLLGGWHTSKSGFIRELNKYIEKPIYLLKRIYE